MTPKGKLGELQLDTVINNTDLGLTAYSFIGFISHWSVCNVLYSTKAKWSNVFKFLNVEFLSLFMFSLDIECV